jgi:hypothetical protein
VLANTVSVIEEGDLQMGHQAVRKKSRKRSEDPKKEGDERPVAEKVQPFYTFPLAVLSSRCSIQASMAKVFKSGSIIADK